jgi:hypothetical protein
MGTLFHGRYNQNDLRNYPLADGAGRTAAGGGILPIDYLVDLSLRYPGPAESVPYVAAAVQTPGLVLLTLAGRTGEGDAILGTVTVVQPLRRMYQPLPIEPVLPGTGGWAVFGASLGSGESFRLAFDDPGQTEILPKAARAYPPPPVLELVPADRARGLSGHVRLGGAGLVEVVQADEAGTDADYRAHPRQMRRISGVQRPALVVQLSRTAAAADLAAFLGICREAGGGECVPPLIRTLNRVEPDAAGNITVEVAGMPVERLVGVDEDGVVASDRPAEGVVLDMPIGLIDVCRGDKGLTPAPRPLPECES